jgi:PPOX class probable F420-dependent enzyme
MNPAEARRTFRDSRVVHVGSLLPDGAPHVVPLWFVWLEDGVYVSCRRESAVWRNITRDPRVALQFDRGLAWTEQAGAVIRGKAEVLPPDEPSTKRALSAWFEKYRGELAGFGFAAYTKQVKEPVMIWVRPDRLATWIHAHRPGA